MQATNHEVFSAWPFTEQVYHAWFRVREAYTISQVKPCRIGLMSSWARVRMVFSVTQLNQGRAGDRTWVWHSYRCVCHPHRAREWSGTISFDFRLRFRFNLSLTKLSVKIQLWSNSWLSNSRLSCLLLTPSCLVGDAMDRTALKSPLDPWRHTSTSCLPWEPIGYYLLIHGHSLLLFLSSAGFPSLCLRSLQPSWVPFLIWRPWPLPCSIVYA